VADPAGYGLLEFSYFEMAKRCGVDMMECRLLHENGRSHFMTRRFDRGPLGDKYFAQTLAAIKHFDYWETGAYSYEQVIMTMRELGMPLTMIEQQVRRIIFNLVACNQDDHVKNISFMMDRQGQWSLSPAYDMCHAEGSVFTRTHQLSLNGKTSDFVIADLKHLAQYAGLPRGREKQILATTLEAFSHWELLAAELDIPLPLQKHVLRTLRLSW
jgi:serine/threonine-protein kinase HipA